MEKGLSKKDKEGEDGSGISWGVFVQEVEDVGFLALPVTLSQNFLQIISMMMVGHLGKLALSTQQLLYLFVLSLAPAFL
jgi:multidrug resistance protein, MATE family